MGNRVRSIVGIVNGTTNYILTRMTEEKLSFAEALAQAQEKGFAEADPTLDVSGGDAAQKIGLLASLAFGCWIEPRGHPLRGDRRGRPRRTSSSASASGFVFKLVAQARMIEGAPLVTVFPALVPLDHPLAGVRDEFNGVLVDSDFLGPSVYEGRGAGGQPHGLLPGLGPRGPAEDHPLPARAPGPSARACLRAAVPRRADAQPVLLPFRHRQQARHLGAGHRHLRGERHQHRERAPEVGGQDEALGPVRARGRGRGGAGARGVRRRSSPRTGSIPSRATSGSWRCPGEGGQ